MELNANEKEEVVFEKSDNDGKNRGREESEEEGAKRRRFLEKVSGSKEGTAEDEMLPKLLEENDSDEEQDAGDVRLMKKLVDPKLPSKDEIEMHNMTHLPFRNWCRHCIKGRGVEAGHFKSVRDEGALPEIHVDFCFPGSTSRGRCVDGGCGPGERYQNDAL